MTILTSGASSHVSRWIRPASNTTSAAAERLWSARNCLFTVGIERLSRPGYSKEFGRRVPALMDGEIAMELARDWPQVQKYEAELADVLAGCS